MATLRDFPLLGSVTLKNQWRYSVLTTPNDEVVEGKEGAKHTTSHYAIETTCMSTHSWNTKQMSPAKMGQFGTVCTKDVEGDRGAGAQENRGLEGYGRREKKGWEAGSLQAFIIYYCLSSSQKYKPSNVFDFHLMFSEASNKILYVRKRKFVLRLKKQDKFW